MKCLCKDKVISIVWLYSCLNPPFAHSFILYFYYHSPSHYSSDKKKTKKKPEEKKMAITLVLMAVGSMLIGLSDCTASLSVMVNRGQDECFYLPKGTGETITASFQVYTPFPSLHSTRFHSTRFHSTHFHSTRFYSTRFHSTRFHSTHFHSTCFHSRILLVAIIQLPMPKWFPLRDGLVIILCI